VQQINTSSPGILIFAEGLLGDALVLTPAIRAIKEYYKTSFLSILLFKRLKVNDSPGHAVIKESEFKGAAEVFLNNPYVDLVLELDRSALRSLNIFKRISSEIKNINILRRNKYDIIICTFPKDRFAIYSYFSGAKIRVGQKKQPLGFLLNTKADITENEYNVIRYFGKLLEPIDIKINDFSTYFNITKENEQEAEEFLKKHGLENSKNIVGIHAGASMPDRTWPAEYFAELINYLRLNVISDVILFYNDFDVPFINEIKKYLKAEIIEAKPRSLSEMGALFKKCSICVTNNSGPRHLAAAVGTRTLGLLFKHDEKKWGIYDTELHPYMESQKPCSICPPGKCNAVIPGNEKYSSICMRDIAPDDVIKKVISMLEHKLIYQKNGT